MNMTIEVDADIANKFLSENLGSLNEDERKSIIKEVLIESVKQSMKSSDSNLLIESSYGTGYRLTRFAERMIDKVDVSSELEELKKKIIKDLIEHHRELVESAILNSLVNTIIGSKSFADAISDTVHQINYQMQNCNR